MTYWPILIKLCLLQLRRLYIVSHPIAAVVVSLIAVGGYVWLLKVAEDKILTDQWIQYLIGACLILASFMVMLLWSSAVRPRRIDLRLNSQIDFLEGLECFYGKIESTLYSECVSFSAVNDARVQYSYKRTFDCGDYKYYNFKDHVVQRFKALTGIDDAEVTSNGTVVTFSMK